MSAPNPHHVEIAKLRSRVAELEAEVAYLKETQNGHRAQQEIAAISQTFGVPPTVAALMRKLSDGNVKSLEALRNRFDAEDDANTKVIDVYISRLRKQFGRDSFITHCRLGRSMSPEMCARVREAMFRGMT